DEVPYADPAQDFGEVVAVEAVTDNDRMTLKRSVLCVRTCRVGRDLQSPGQGRLQRESDSWRRLDQEWRSDHGDDGRGEKFLVIGVLQQSLCKSHLREHKGKLSYLGEPDRCQGGDAQRIAQQGHHREKYKRLAG